MKKKLTIVISVLLLGVLAFFVFFPGPVISYDKQLFIENKSFYDDVATVCNEYYKKSKLSDIGSFTPSYDGDSLYCSNNEEYYSLTTEQQNSLKIVEEKFRLDHHSLGYLCVTDNYVIFKIENGRASFIYSVDNSKPNFVNTPKENLQHIYVEKIVDNWYFACRQD